MYVVFVNDKPIFLTSSQIKENKYPVYLLKDIVTEEIIHKLKDKKLKGINLYTPDLELGWQEFLSTFNVVSAAGGLVVNPKNEILFIYRSYKWDLPKGRIEKGETVKETVKNCGRHSTYPNSIGLQLLVGLTLVTNKKNKQKQKQQSNISPPRG